LETKVAIEAGDAVLVPPVDIGEGVTIEASVVGPNVSIDDGASVRQSILRESIRGQSATLENVNLVDSIVGNSASVQGEANHLNVGDSSTIHL
ncbi:dTDP-glucose pyrophosphorylase, partial [Halorubrum sp. Atlit-26R]